MRHSSAKKIVYSNSTLPQETREKSNKETNFIPKETSKMRLKKKKNPQFVKEKKKIRAEINEKEMKEAIAKINKTKSQFFGRIN